MVSHATFDNYIAMVRIYKKLFYKKIVIILNIQMVRYKEARFHFHLMLEQSHQQMIFI